MDTLLRIATDVIAPIFIIVGVSFLMDRAFKPDPRGLSRVVVYLFTPFLVIEGIANTEIGGEEAVQLFVITILLTLIVTAAAWAVARALHYDRKLTSAFMLSVALINSGNFGIPVCELAFGEAGASRGLLFFVSTMLATYTLGVYLASSGTMSARESLRRVFLNPMPYALLIGFIMNRSGVRVYELEPAFRKPIEWLGEAAIPTMMVVLGIQLSRAKLTTRLVPILYASGLRLLLSPLIAAILALLMGMSDIAKQVSITQAAMPTAVIAGVLATEFGGEEDFVTGTILISTLLSFLTLAVVLALVM